MRGASPTALAGVGIVLPLASDPHAPGRFAAALARQVRQDVWRALRRVRGFVPEIEVVLFPGRVAVTAGGALRAGPAPPTAGPAIAALLGDPARHRRWLAEAYRRAGGRAVAEMAP